MRTTRSNALGNIQVRVISGMAYSINENTISTRGQVLQFTE